MSRQILLFDVDGTLTEPRRPISAKMQQCLKSMRSSFELAIVSGSDLVKIKEQLGDSLFDEFDYVFAENGLMAYHNGQLIASKSIIEHLGKDNVRHFTDYCLEYISKIDIPVKTSKFVELRQGLINVSPIGRNCTLAERNAFLKYDLVHKVREKMINNLKNYFLKLDLVYSIGGQISFDVFPKGWDKSYCLQYLHNKDQVIHFFGDKTEKGGNDHEIFIDSRVIGHAVNNFEDTILALEKLKKGSPDIKPVLQRASDNPLLSPIKTNSWESEAVYNPAAILLNGIVHLIYRAAGNDWLTVFGYATSKDGIHIDERLPYPVFRCGSLNKYNPYSSHQFQHYSSGGSVCGSEDPRLVQIGQTIFMTYTYYDGYSAPRMAITSISVADFLARRFRWKPPVFLSHPGQVQKNWVLFPEKIKGKYALLHAITPEISIDYLDNLDFEVELYIHSNYSNGNREAHWDNWVRGAGPPPMRISDGWLLLYHAMDKRDPGKYKLGAMILDADDPTRILYRSNKPLLEPIEDYENSGFKPGVIYCCGAFIKEDELYIYYGGADTVACVAHGKLADILTRIRGEA